MRPISDDLKTAAPVAGFPSNEGPRPLVLELRKVTCAYEVGRAAISDVSFSVREGDILCLLGPSGCGKTTTLRVIAGFEPVVGGEVYLEGQLASAPGLLLPTERRRVGMVFQEYALFPHLRVVENIEHVAPPMFEEPDDPA